jgi:hypothetical protein
MSDLMNDVGPVMFILIKKFNFYSGILNGLNYTVRINIADNVNVTNNVAIHVWFNVAKNVDAKSFTKKQLEGAYEKVI